MYFGVVLVNHMRVILRTELTILLKIFNVHVDMVAMSCVTIPHILVVFDVTFEP